MQKTMPEAVTIPFQKLMGRLGKEPEKRGHLCEEKVLRISLAIVKDYSPGELGEIEAVEPDYGNS